MIMPSTYQIPGCGEPSATGVKLGELVKAACHHEEGELRHTAWRLGLLYQANGAAHHARSSGGSYFFYVIKPIIKEVFHV